MPSGLGVARILLATLVLLAAGCQPVRPIASSPATPDATSGAATTNTAPATGIERTYTDPRGLYAVPVPAGWTVDEQEGYTLLSDPDQAILVYLLAVEAADIPQAIADAWKRVDPGFALEASESTSLPSDPGIEATLEVAYKTLGENRIVLAQGRLKEGIVYAALYDVQLAVLQKRNAQLIIVSTGFEILSQQEADLSEAQPLAVSDVITEPLEAFIEEYMAAFGIPGAAVGVVQDGQVVFAKGFGVANPTTGAPMTRDTHMMIGSTGKSLTTLMMATLVDDGLMTWDTPAVELYPAFRIKDPDLTEIITMRNLVCACTGVPRRDMEWLFNYNSLTPEDAVAALADFELYTDFGKAFQYSNQMVATAGYIAGQVATGNNGNLADDYANALRSRVLEPIGMDSTTISFDQVMEEGNYAVPYTRMLDNTYEPLPVEVERSLEALGPAGAHWSTLNDMARYMLTQLGTGIAPSGARVVSAQNLDVTREPQIAINADTRYGLGWMVTDYHGQPLITHGGNTSGFTSEFTFLPNAQLGVIVLTNARASNLFNGSVTQKLLELVFEQAPQVGQQLDFSLQQMANQASALEAKIAASVDEVAVQPFLGEYNSPVLGDAELSLRDGKLLLDVGEFVAELRPYNDPDRQFTGYVQVSAPGQGLTYRLVNDANGQPQVVFVLNAEEYIFTRR